MSFDQFPDTQLVRVMETNETADMGGFEVDESIELDQIVLRINKDGTATGSETFVVEVYQSENATSPLYSSDSQTFNDINSDLSGFNALTAASMLADVAFNFNRESLREGVKYFLKLKMTSYTRNGDTFFIGWCFDFIEPVNDVASAGSYAARALFVGFR